MFEWLTVSFLQFIMLDFVKNVYISFIFFFYNEMDDDGNGG